MSRSVSGHEAQLAISVGCVNPREGGRVDDLQSVPKDEFFTYGGPEELNSSNEGDAVDCVGHVDYCVQTLDAPLVAIARADANSVATRVAFAALRRRDQCDE